MFFFLVFYLALNDGHDLFHCLHWVLKSCTQGLKCSLMITLSTRHRLPSTTCLQIFWDLSTQGLSVFTILCLCHTHTQVHFVFRQPCALCCVHAVISHYTDQPVIILFSHCSKRGGGSDSTRKVQHSSYSVYSVWLWFIIIIHTFYLLFKTPLCNFWPTKTKHQTHSRWFFGRNSVNPHLLSKSERVRSWKTRVVTFEAWAAQPSCHGTRVETGETRKHCGWE